MKQGRKPSLEEIAEAALVSRATAYRYFPSLDQLLLEAELDVAMPGVERIFTDQTTADPVARLDKLDTAIDEMMKANETQLRMMLAQSLERRLAGGDSGLPPRQNRRSPLIEQALEPARAEFTPRGFDTLAQALALILGTEAMVVFKDVLQVDDAEAKRVKRFAIKALVEAARKGDRIALLRSPRARGGPGLR